jgi:hypothetical protein
VPTIAPVVVRTDRELGSLADFGTGGMLCANMLIVLLIGGRAVRCLEEYRRRLRMGEFKAHAPRPLLEMVEEK